MGKDLRLANLAGVVNRYATRGYDWLAVTDHNLGVSAEKAAQR